MIHETTLGPHAARAHTSSSHVGRHTRGPCRPPPSLAQTPYLTGFPRAARVTHERLTARRSASGARGVRHRSTTPDAIGETMPTLTRARADWHRLCGRRPVWLRRQSALPACRATTTASPRKSADAGLRPRRHQMPGAHRHPAAQARAARRPRVPSVAYTALDRDIAARAQAWRARRRRISRERPWRSFLLVCPHFPLWCAGGVLHRYPPYRIPLPSSTLRRAPGASVSASPTPASWATTGLLRRRPRQVRRAIAATSAGSFMDQTSRGTRASRKPVSPPVRASSTPASRDNVSRVGCGQVDYLRRIAGVR